MTEPAAHPHRKELDRELGNVRTLINTMGEMVDRAISRAVWGLTQRSVSLCNAVIADDSDLNDMQRRLREQVFQIALTQAPVAGDLREIMGFLHMSAELERMGDHCVSIAKIARTLADLPELQPRVDLPKMALYCQEQVRDILAAVIARNPDAARAVAERDDRVDRIY
ncbi:MAG TPA: PhoU domain-containing protein, partial [Candidatus Dormibacteraeota bacterium]|nr:PhoU domain-containing protein [Candidatus Dormibacteraeota bacterium]